jgi:hypothetical protein
MARIYVTHCSKKKEDKYRRNGERVTADKLYTSAKTQTFINTCKTKGVNWAIFSDKYGIIFPDDKIAWYEKSPDLVSETEKKELLLDFLQRLEQFDDIYFYYNPGRFHRLYKSLLEQASKKLKGIHLITHISDIRL